MITQEQFNNLMDAWIEQQKAIDKPSDYAAPALAWAKNKGIMKGNASGNQMPKAFITREDVAVILKRALDGDEEA